MKKALRELVAVGMLGLVSVGVFGQKQDPPKRPPKEQEKVVTSEKKESRPQQNNNQPKHDKNKKP